MKQNAIFDAWIISEDKNRPNIYRINHAIKIRPNEPPFSKNLLNWWFVEENFNHAKSHDRVEPTNSVLGRTVEPAVYSNSLATLVTRVEGYRYIENHASSIRSHLCVPQYRSKFNSTLIGAWNLWFWFVGGFYRCECISNARKIVAEIFFTCFDEIFIFKLLFSELEIVHQ